MLSKRLWLAVLSGLLVLLFAGCGGPSGTSGGGSDDDDNDRQAEASQDAGIFGFLAEGKSSPALIGGAPVDVPFDEDAVPGGSAKMLPHDTLFYTWAQMDPESPQWEARKKLAERVQAADPSGQMFNNLFNWFGRRVQALSLEEIERDWKSWIKEGQTTAIIGYNPDDYPSTQSVMLTGVRDQNHYRNYRAELVERGDADEQGTEQVAGREVYKCYRWDADTEELYTIEGDYVVSSDELDSIKYFFEKQGEQSLADNPVYQRAVRSTMPDTMAFIFLNIGSIYEKFPEYELSGTPLGQTKPILQGVDYLSVNARLLGDGLQMVMTAGLDPSVRAEVGPFPSVLDSVPKDVIACFLIPNGKRLVSETINLFRADEEFNRTFNQGMDLMRQQVGLDLEYDILPCIDGEIAFLLFPKEGEYGSPGFAVVCKPTSYYSSESSLRRVVDAIAAQQEPLYKEEGPGGLRAGFNVGLFELHVRAAENMIFLVSKQELVDRIILAKGKGEVLSTTDFYKRAVENLPIKGGGFFYLKVDEAVGAISSMLPTGNMEGASFLGNLIGTVNKLDGQIRIDIISELAGGEQKQEEQPEIAEEREVTLDDSEIEELESIGYLDTGEPPEEEEYTLVSGAIEKPEFISEGSIIYPQRAKLLRKAGYAFLEVKISKTGEIVEINILDEQPPDFGFGDAAKAYFEQGKWRPAKYNGEPINAIYRFRFDYKLQ